MTKLIAILNVVAWGGFWAFGYVALTTHSANTNQIVVAVMLAFAGAVAGLFAYSWLARHSEATGYAKRAGLTSEEREAAQAEGETNHAIS